MPRTLALLVSFLLLVAGVLTACGGSDKPATPSSMPGHTSMTMAGPTSSTTPAQPAGPQIEISGMAFKVPGSVRPGQQITVVNKDETAHSVTSDEPSLFDVRVSGGISGDNGVSTFTAPSAPGTYAFHCKYHSNMHGTLVVQ